MTGMRAIGVSAGLLALLGLAGAGCSGGTTLGLYSPPDAGLLPDGGLPSPVIRPLPGGLPRPGISGTALAGADAGTDGGVLPAGDGGTPGLPDAGVPPSGTPDAGDAGAAVGPSGDAGADDAGNGGGTVADAGNGGGPTPDAGSDAGSATAGGGSDAGGGGFPPAPWPTAPVTVYGAGQGIQEMPVVAVQPDEADNLWVVTHEALYLLRPGAAAFQRYDDSDGLHVGLALQPYGITGVAGGAPDQAFVGYEGWVDGTPTLDTQAEKDMGKFDRVDLQADGSLAVTRFNVYDTNDMTYWENRSVRRFLYDHSFHPGTLYVGMNHGVDRVNGDAYADHIHVQNCTGSCAVNPSEQCFAEWRGLALDAQGNLWMADEFTAGEIGWTPVLLDWIDNGKNPFINAFGDPYPPFPPVFEPPAECDSVNIRADAVTPDGLVWFASGFQWSPGTDPEYGIASYDPSTQNFAYYDPIALGFGTKDLMDMVALPDGRLMFGTAANGIVTWNPKTLAVSTTTTANGLPSDSIGLMYLVPWVSPPAVFAATDGGAVLLRP